MTFKATFKWFASTAALFAVCCVVMVRFGPDMNAAIVVYPFMIVWGLSALAWPLFAVLAFRARNVG
jgi:hypothetical protein